jgi:alcohol dehydrogenase YqhD (iron-dependent ADH family)
MENFVLYNPVRLHFGQGVVDSLGFAAATLGKKALLVYGKGSVKKNGAYDQTVRSLTGSGIEIIEYNGIKPNPLIEDVDQAAALGKAEGVDMIVAVGGGSVLDSAKVMAITIPADHSGWLFVEGSKKPQTALPVIGVLTLAATGTEMNGTAVVQNNALERKAGYKHRLMYPKHSFLDPAFTSSVPANYTAYGIVDLIAHALEVWFGEGDASLSDKFITSIIKEALEYGPALMNDLHNTDLRARIMYAATCALNGMTFPGKKYGDWAVHGIGHCLSVMYDTAHGATLSIAYPAWLKIHAERIPERIALLGKELFHTTTAEETIDRLTAFFSLLGSPVTLAEAGIKAGNHDKQQFLSVMNKNKVDGLVYKLSAEDHHTLFELMAG